MQRVVRFKIQEVVNAFNADMRREEIRKLYVVQPVPEEASAGRPFRIIGTLYALIYRVAKGYINNRSTKKRRRG